MGEGLVKQIGGQRYDGDGQGNWYKSQYTNPTVAGGKYGLAADNTITGQNWLSRLWNGTGESAGLAIGNTYDANIAGGMSPTDAATHAQASYDALNTQGAFDSTGLGGEIGSAVKGMDPKSGAGGAGGSVIGGLASAVNIGTNLYNMFDKSAEKAAAKQLAKENKRADELMAMNREKYNTFKADKKRLGLAYGGN